MPDYELYRDDIETVKQDETETHAKIIRMMTDGTHNAREKYGRDVRASHAKAFALLKGELVVSDGLAPELAQGLFAKPGRYPVLVRMASAPGELLDDSKVNPTRGMALKVFGVTGEWLAPYGGVVQDFLLAPGKEFTAATAETFVPIFKPNPEIATKLSDTTKGIVSDVSRLTNAALNAVGINSGKLDFYGHPKVHPLGEAHYSQTPLRYGAYVAKLAAVPDSTALDAVLDKEIELKTPDALREAAVEFFRSNPAEYSIQAQLNVDLSKMPIEDATAAWPEDLSAYREVARLILPPQDAWDRARDEFFEEMSFAPAHTLAAHRPLGSINRARLVVYGAMSRVRHEENGQAEIVPESAEVIPA